MVPKVDQPTNGGKETKKTHHQRAMKAHGDVSHCSATGPSQIKTFPVKARKLAAKTLRSKAAKTAPTRCHSVILLQVRNTCRDVLL